MFVVEVATVLVCGMVGKILSDSKVNMATRYSSTHIKLVCTTQFEEKAPFSMHLRCPFTETEICYTNCNANENSNKDSNLRMIDKCEFSLNQNQFTVTYEVNTALVSKTGKWLCVYKGIKSNDLEITKYETPTMTTKTTAILTKDFHVQTKEIFNVQSNKNVPTLEPSTIYKLNSTFKSVYLTPKLETGHSTILKILTQPEIVLALVAMLGFSLLLNLSFLIRCVLLKSVIDNYHRGIHSSSCVMGCLCIDQYSQRKKYSHSINLSNQIGSDLYRCQPLSPDNLAIYDDLSAVSNSSARVKLRSNHSSDVDEETMLTSLMPNGGSQFNAISVGSVSTTLPRRYTSPNHTAYFHPGLGNYVIVSGPIATHDQYTIGAAPPGYALQMVSPIPSAPGSITGGQGTNISLQSGNSDDLIDSDHSQTTNSITNQSIKQNNQPIDIIDANRMLDLSQTMNVRMNGFSPNRQIVINSPSNYNRSNGSVPRHPWSMEKVPFPTSSSVTSLPQYSTSENGIYVQDKHQIKDPLITS